MVTVTSIIALVTATVMVKINVIVRDTRDESNRGYVRVREIDVDREMRRVTAHTHRKTSRICECAEIDRHIILICMHLFLSLSLSLSLSLFLPYLPIFLSSFFHTLMQYIRKYSYMNTYVWLHLRTCVYEHTHAHVHTHTYIRTHAYVLHWICKIAVPLRIDRSSPRPPQWFPSHPPRHTHSWRTWTGGWGGCHLLCVVLCCVMWCAMMRWDL